MTTNNVEVLSCNAIVKDFCQKHDPRNNQPLRKALLAELLRGEFHTYFFKSDFEETQDVSDDTWDVFANVQWDELNDNYYDRLHELVREAFC